MWILSYPPKLHPSNFMPVNVCGGAYEIQSEAQCGRESPSGASSLHLVLNFLAQQILLELPPLFLIFPFSLLLCLLLFVLALGLN